MITHKTTLIPDMKHHILHGQMQQLRPGAALYHGPSAAGRASVLQQQHWKPRDPAPAEAVACRHMSEAKIFESVALRIMTPETSTDHKLKAAEHVCPNGFGASSSVQMGHWQACCTVSAGPKFGAQPSSARVTAAAAQDADKCCPSSQPTRANLHTQDCSHPNPCTLTCSQHQTPLQHSHPHPPAPLQMFSLHHPLPSSQPPHSMPCPSWASRIAPLAEPEERAC